MTAALAGLAAFLAVVGATITFDESRHVSDLTGRVDMRLEVVAIGAVLIAVGVVLGVLAFR